MGEKQLFTVKDKVIAVTGGSSGLGLRMVKVLAEHGARVASIARSHDHVDASYQDRDVLQITGDVTSSQDISAAFDQIEQTLGPLSVVFNNAGVAHKARVLDTTPEMFDHMFAVNVAGAFFVAREAARRIIAQGRGGAIINTTSILGERPQKGAAVYSMTKACVTQMTRALALEFAAHDIRVNALSPGWFPTGINEAELAGPAGSFLKGCNPMRRLGDLSDIDGAVLLLASDASRYMTGSIITIDGGHQL